MSELVKYHVEGSCAILSINNPPVNALGPGVAHGILNGVKAAIQDSHVQAIILIGDGRTFIAGADIKDFVKITRGLASWDNTIQEMMTALEQSTKPTICAIHGTALGGGLETAQACHYRIALKNSQVGQPEVKLGLIPGAGGTQRLPRLIGMEAAALMCTSGDMMPATQAHSLGLIDALFDGDLLPNAITFAQQIVANPSNWRRTCDRTEKLNAAIDLPTLEALKVAVAKKARGLTAPLQVLEAMKAIPAMDFEAGIRRESEIFRDCLYSDQSKSLVHAFLSERAVSKIPGLAKETVQGKIRCAAVIGAGTMGGGIAMNYANAGIPVLLKESEEAALQRGVQRIRANYQATVEKGKMTAEQLEQRMSLIQPTLDYQRFPEADIVVEAVFEGMDLKKQIFREIDAVAKPGAILASNTSTLDIDEIASVTGRPQQVIGHHFFSPANVMKLLEIVRGKETSAEVIATSMALAKKLNKVGVLVGNCRGFVGNRMFDPYTREAQFLVEEGASVADVDQALTQWGMAMGPFAVCDLAGVDVCWRIRQEYKHTFPTGQRDVLVVDQLYELGRYGQKSGAGWYQYEGRNAVSDPVVENLIASTATQAGISRRSISPQEIIERTVYTLINEGARILEEGLAIRSSDIDIIYLYGYGFPAFRGGPMFYADTVGLQAVYERILTLEAEHGSLWSPSPLLRELATSGSSFSAWDANR